MQWTFSFALGPYVMTTSQIFSRAAFPLKQLVYIYDILPDKDTHIRTTLNKAPDDVPFF